MSPSAMVSNEAVQLPAEVNDRQQAPSEKAFEARVSDLASFQTKAP